MAGECRGVLRSRKGVTYMAMDTRKKASEVLDEFKTLERFLETQEHMSIKCNAVREELLGLSKQLRSLKAEMITAVLESSGLMSAEKKRAEALLNKTIDAVICGVESRADLYSKVLSGEVSTL